MRAIFYQRRDYTHYIDGFVYRFIRLMTDLLLFFLGLALCFGGVYLEKYENTIEKQALEDFLKSFSAATYETALDYTMKVPEGVSVYQLEEVGYKSYFVKASSGKYSFEGTITHGRTEKSIQYLQEETFWRMGVVLTFSGEIISILGLFWVIAKKSMGIKSMREFHRDEFIFGDYR